MVGAHDRKHRGPEHPSREPPHISGIRGGGRVPPPGEDLARDRRGPRKTDSKRLLDQSEAIRRDVKAARPATTPDPIGWSCHNGR